MEQGFQSIYNASNRFGLKLLQSFAHNGLPKNIFFSPLSISMCLTLATIGANDQTRYEMQQALCLADLSLDEINRANQYLIGQFNVIEENTDDEPEPEENPDEIRPIRKRRVPPDELNNAYRVIDIMRNLKDEKDMIAQFGEDYNQQWREAFLVMVSAKTDSRFKLTLANSLWVKKGIEFEPEFLSTTHEFYNAKVASLDFSDKAAPDMINSWINQATQGTIREMVGRISPATMFILANAIYFKAFWRDKFSKRKTKVEKFTLLSGEQVDCSMMHELWKFRYWENNDLQMIRIPYESVADLNLGMYIILPKRSQDLNKLVSELSLEKWNWLFEQVHRQQVWGNLGLPRFKADYERELTDDLIALGMEMAVTPRADFSAMSKIALPLWISKVIHKAFINVDEQGTEVSAAQVLTTILGITEPEFNMIVDHPFIYAIRDYKSGALLFMGVTMQPN